MNVEDLWKKNGSGIEMFRLSMSLGKDRFLIRHIRFDDIETLSDAFVDICKSVYTPYHYVTIDEKLETFRGRCSFRQYIPNKPNKYGLKIFALFDSKTYYTCNLEVYVGKQPSGPYEVSNSPGSVVERLSEHIRGTGRNITVDNWFTSIDLIERLKTNFRLTLLGTIRKNKRASPSIFKSSEPSRENIYVCLLSEKNVPWYRIFRNQKKKVLLVSSMHYYDDIDEDTGKPEIIKRLWSLEGDVASATGKKSTN
ncbi:hypothetical protein NQ318_022988 [Aromia moschata]|uniref:PiggyBac transposable element-derived protein domain-containing protein n=1 Tax=Aromia moschata TaxID=1265417 RepID=A0AAV8YDK3_9CUCU|nr:hypothetical protein NQ318_022988 [Aromia moschata]